MARQSKVRASHLIEYAFYRLAEFFFSFLPMSAVCRLGRGLGFLAYIISARYRALVLRNLRIAVGERHDVQSIEELAIESFKKGGANLLSSLKAATMKPEKLAEFVTVRGKEHLSALNEKGEGAIVAMGHMGSWEVLTRLNLVISPGASWGAVFRPLNNPLMDRLIRKRRSAENLQLFSSKESFLKGSVHLKDGGFLLVLSDQRAKRVGTVASFFGRVSSCVPLPALLAKRSGVGVLALSMEMTELGRWEVVIEKVSEGGEPVTTSQVMAGIERAMSRSLADGFWFHDRWRLEKKPFFFPFKKSDLDTLKQGKPMRVICYGEELREEWVESMRNALPAVEVFHAWIDADGETGKRKVNSLSARDQDSLVRGLKAAEDEMAGPFELVIDLTGGEVLANFSKERRIPFYSNTEGHSVREFLENLGAEFLEDE